MAISILETLLNLSLSFFIEDAESPMDPIIQAGETEIMSCTRDNTQVSPMSPSQPASKKDSSPVEKISALKSSLPPSSRDVEGNSAESGDSEIDLVSEESSPQAPSSGYMSFNKTPATAPSTIVPSTAPVPSSTTAIPKSLALQYSILREEREAELDSELALESCGEESPKRLTHGSSKGYKEIPQVVKKPTIPTSATKEPFVTSTTPPTILAPTSAPKEKMSTMEEKPKHSTMPSPGLPELKVEHPAGEVHKKERRRSSQARRGSEKTSAPPVVFQGFSREKGKRMFSNC